MRRDEIQSLMSRAAPSVPPRVPPQKLLSVQNPQRSSALSQKRETKARDVSRVTQEFGVRARGWSEGPKSAHHAHRSSNPVLPAPLPSSEITPQTLLCRSSAASGAFLRQEETLLFGGSALLTGPGQEAQRVNGGLMG